MQVILTFCTVELTQMTLLQLRNLLNRRNVSRDTKGHFNESIDYHELVVTGYILSATRHYFGLTLATAQPTRNASLLQVSPHTDGWQILRSAVRRMWTSTLLCTSHPLMLLVRVTAVLLIVHTLNA